jgi:hypothetical protein
MLIFGIPLCSCSFWLCCCHFPIPFKLTHWRHREERQWKKLTYSVVGNSAYKIRILGARVLSLTAGIRVRSLSLMPLSAQHIAFHSSARIKLETAAFVIFNKEKFTDNVWGLLTFSHSSYFINGLKVKVFHKNNCFLSPACTDFKYCRRYWAVNWDVNLKALTIKQPISNVSCVANDWGIFSINSIS